MIDLDQETLKKLNKSVSQLTDSLLILNQIVIKAAESLSQFVEIGEEDHDYVAQAFLKRNQTNAGQTGT